MVESAAHTLLKKRRLQPATAQLRDGGRTSEQCNSLMHTQHASGAGLTVNLCEEAQTLLACSRDVPDLQNKIQEIRMFVGPASGANVIPKLRFFRIDYAYADMGVFFKCGSLDRAIEDVADLDRPVVAGAEQAQRSGPRERTHFMKHRRTAVEKEALDHIQRGRAQFLEYAESETLSDRRVDTVEHCVCPCAFDPLGATIGE